MKHFLSSLFALLLTTLAAQNVGHGPDACHDLGF